MGMEQEACGGGSGGVVDQVPSHTNTMTGHKYKHRFFFSFQSNTFYSFTKFQAVCSLKDERLDIFVAIRKS